MRTTIGAVGLLALARVVVAQEACLSLTTKFPDCAFPCVTSAASAVGCEGTDLACRCDPTKSAAIQQSAVGCVIGNCATVPGAIGAALEAGTSVCACVATATSTTSSTSSTTSSSSSSSITAPPGEDCDTESPCQATADKVPKCAESCIFSAAETQAKCDTTDFECQCSSTSIIQSAAQNCVISGCGVATAVDVLSSVAALCECVSDNPTTPCTGTNTGTGSGTTKPPTTTTKPPTTKPTTTKPPNTPTTTCKSATTSDCGPVASSAVPECAQACFKSAAPKVGCTDPDDYSCQCQDEARESLTQLLVPCVATACDAAALPSVISGADKVCSCALAPPFGGDCGPGKPTGGHGGSSSHKPTQTGGHGGKPTDKPTTTCKEATTSDCAPLASTAIPSCAQACFSSAAPQIGCDDATDFSCQCQPEAQASLSSILVPCVASRCPAASLTAVITGASEVCACATAPPSGGNCEGGGGGGGGHPTAPPSEPTGGYGGGNGGHGGEGESSCVEGTTQDCGPVASSAVPECAQACFASAAPEVGCNDPNDYSCQCQPEAQESLSAILVPCVASRCPATELPNVIAGASSVCACAAAAPTGGSCPGNGGNGPAPQPPKPTAAPGGGNGGHGGEGECKPGSSADCGAVATSAVPECAQACFKSAAPDVNCGAEDYACQCQPDTQESLSQLLIPCVASRCDAAALPSVIAGASQVCACATAAPGGSGDCGSVPPVPLPSPTGGSGGSEGGNEGGSTCKAAAPTANDCGPVASSAIPECAQECFTIGAPQVGCDASEYGCLCQEDAQASLSKILVPCVASKCPAAQLTAVIAGASSVCECALAEPTGGSGADTCEPTSGSRGSEGGGEGGNSQPSPTGPVVVPGAGARMEISIVAAVFGSFWLIAVML